ncbi:ABC transporter ATP-binding protein [Kaarinaea lacus]
MASLTVKKLKFHHLGPISFKILASQCASLTGPSGIGKSLLLRAIADLIPHQGDIFIDDSDCQALPAPQWRKLAGLLPAKSVWWFDAVGEHFHSVDETAFGALNFNRDVLQWSVKRLSTGEQQRLSLLRMLQNTPKVLLLDEPTASLDADNVSRVETLIKTYQQQQSAAVLWVTHDKEQAQRIAERYLLLHTHEIVEQILEQQQP